VLVKDEEARFHSKRVFVWFKTKSNPIVGLDKHIELQELRALDQGSRNVLRVFAYVVNTLRKNHLACRWKV